FRRVLFRSRACGQGRHSRTPRPIAPHARSWQLTPGLAMLVALSCHGTGSMSLLFAVLLIGLAWGLGALQLWPRTRWVGDVLPWLGAVLALAVAGCVVLGIAGMLLPLGDWQSPSMGQTLHQLLGEGTLAMRRSGRAWLDGAANVYLNLDIA